MPRKNVKVIKRSKAHWSRENIGVTDALPNTQTNGLYQAGSIIVPPSTVQGARTIANLRLTLANNGADLYPMYYALVYVPQGETAKALFASSGAINSGSVYEPNQYVLSCGCLDPDAGNKVIRANISRRLHSGDFISLIWGSTNQNQFLSGIVSYSVKYN